MIVKEPLWGKSCESRVDQHRSFAKRGLASLLGWALQQKKRMLLENVPSQINLGKVPVLSPTSCRGQGKEGASKQGSKTIKLMRKPCTFLQYNPL